MNVLACPNVAAVAGLCPPYQPSSEVKEHCLGQTQQHLLSNLAGWLSPFSVALALLTAASELALKKQQQSLVHQKSDRYSFILLFKEEAGILRHLLGC